MSRSIRVLYVDGDPPFAEEVVLALERQDDRFAVETVATATAVTVRVGSLPDGFYVEDDGVGIAPPDRGHVFESGHSTDSDGTGLVSSARLSRHTAGTKRNGERGGGARLEVTDVDVSRA